MKKISWQLVLGALLIALSAAIYFVHFLIFRDPVHIFKYMISDIAFLPIEVLLVTVIIHQLLDMRQKQDRMDKLYMVIGVFFSEAGNKLLTHLSKLDPQAETIRMILAIGRDTAKYDFDQIKKKIKLHSYSVDPARTDLHDLSRQLSEKRELLLRLLENPNLQEHESFTSLLQAVFHLTEEFMFRDDLAIVSGSDKEHLIGDVDRVYNLLVREWVDYAEHLKNNFPYLFSLTVRMNPFDKNASPIVK